MGWRKMPRDYSPPDSEGGHFLECVHSFHETSFASVGLAPPVRPLYKYKGGTAREELAGTR